MKRVAISQPMFFPWVGLFEQIRLVDIFVYYDDVQFSKGSFVNRVQIKTSKGSQWLTVPLKNFRLGQLIKDVVTEDGRDWRRSHLDVLAQVYAKAPFADEMLAVVKRVYERPLANLSGLVISSMDAICEYFDLGAHTQFLVSSQIGIQGKSSQRVLDIVKHLGGDVYITGHGARNYLEHELFEANGIRVEYMNYQKKPYPQLYGEFNPYVSVLDLIANTGRGGRDVICSGTIYWRNFVNHERSS